MTIYVFSNVAYPASRKIEPEEDDLLVFLNTAKSAGYYRSHRKKCVYHRSENRKAYGEIVPGMPNYYVYGGQDRDVLEKRYIDEINREYDFDYTVPAGSVKSATTGYYVAEFIRKRYGLDKVVLVNFGYEVKNSTFRCEYHNWEFEAERLKKYKHIYTCEVKENAD